MSLTEHTNDAFGTSSHARLYQQSETAYVLPVDDEEGQRLHKQHKLFEGQYHHGSLLPDYIKLETTARILDAGTGTGIWSLDLASRLPPTVSFVATDISTRLFPLNPPSNITFLEHSTLSALPTEWTNSFDLVHQRLMMVAFRSVEWEIAVANFYAALKPGGAVILMECRATDYGPKGSATEQAWTIPAELMTRRGVYYDEPSKKLPQWLEQAGFVDVQVEESRVELRSPEGEAHVANIVDLLKAMSGLVASAEGLSWKGTSAEYEAIVEEAGGEYRRSPNLFVYYMWFTARKPL